MFKQIKESNYEISDEGIIRNKKTKKELKYHINHNGYYKISLNLGEGKKTYFVHRLVAMVYLPKIEGKEYINHLNSNKLDNRVINLEWCTTQENNAHAYLNNSNMSKKRAVIAIDKETGKEIKFTSVYQGAKYIGGKEAKAKEIEHIRNNIVLCCQGKIKSSKGYIWKFI